MSRSPSTVKSPLAPQLTTGADVGTAELLLIVLCFVLSGAAALIYQIAWTRQFALVFGTSELAVATVLAAYMGGLALGAWLVERWLPRVQRPVFTYAVLELGIAVAAVALVPLLLQASSLVLQAVAGGQPAPPSSEQVSTSALYLVTAFVALVIPTTLMGATLPLLARHAVHSPDQIGKRIGMLYASNTLGAVLGALLAAFVLLPALGLSRSVWTGAALNLIVFLFAAWIAQRRPATDAAASTVRPAAAAPAAGRDPRRWALPGTAWILPLMLLSGAVSFTYEVLWTRMLSHIVGSSIYAFGVMVSSFLAGIAAGGAFGAWLAINRTRAVNAWVVAQLVSAAWGLIAFLLLDRAIPEQTGLYANAALAFLLLLPLTFAIGTTYPLAVRILAEDTADAAPASARVYAWNTVGAIAGSLAAGFYLVPALRYEGTVQVAIVASTVLALLALLLLERPRLWVLGAVAVPALAVLLLVRPSVPEKLLLTSPLAIPNTGEILHYDVGRSASVVVLRQDGGLALRTNGLPEALMDSPGMTARFSGEFWMSSLAVITRPEIADMLVVGYGGGVVLEGVPPSVRRVDVIELEPKVIAANAATRAQRKFDPLSDPRVNVITNDARGALTLTDKRYDAIVSQPSHPWTAGASHLYTREFMQLARARLVDGGVFVQWMNVAFVDEPLLRSLTATLIDVFGAVRIYRPDPNTLVFVASSGPLDPEPRLLRTGAPLSLTPLHYGRFGINTAEDLIVALAADEAGAERLAAGKPLITDDTNRMATSSVYELGRGLNADAAGRALAAYDPLQRADSPVFTDYRNALDYGYMVRRLLFFRAIDPSVVDRVRRMTALIPFADQRGYAQVLLTGALGDAPRADALARELAATSPGNSRLLFTALQGEFNRAARGEPPSSIDAERATTALPVSAQATLRAVRLLRAQDMGGLAQLDPALAEAGWTDPWFADAVQLRAEWRARVANPEVARAYADEAIALLDRLAVVQPSLGLHVLRSRAALTGDRPDVLIESVAQITSWTIATTGGTESARARTRTTLNELLALLADRDADPRVDVTRLKEVRERIRTALEELSP
jgi:spermidine synthase